MSQKRSPPRPGLRQANRKSAIANLKSGGGEDRNRTCPGSYEPTTVLKTARATRHPSLSEKKETSNPPPPRTGSAVASVRPAFARDGLRRGERPTPNYRRSCRFI